MRCNKGRGGKGQAKSYSGRGETEKVELGKMVIQNQVKSQMRGQVQLANKDHECGGR